MKKIKMLLLICSCLVAFSSAFANTSITNPQKHKDWYSMLFTTSSGINGRVATAAKFSNAVFTLDFFYYDEDHKDSGDISWDFFISTPKQDRYKGKITVRTPVDVSCALRVDSKTVYSTRCKFLDDEETTYLKFDEEGIPKEFLAECAEGTTLRFKFNMLNKDYFERFSLSGFTSACNRAQSLLKANSDSAVNSDAAYFDN